MRPRHVTYSQSSDAPSPDRRRIRQGYCRRCMSFVRHHQVYMRSTPHLRVRTRLLSACFFPFHLVSWIELTAPDAPVPHVQAMKQPPGIGSPGGNASPVTLALTRETRYARPFGPGAGPGPSRGPGARPGFGAAPAIRTQSKQLGKSLCIFLFD